MDHACRAAIVYTDGMQACVAAIRVLEDSPLTNAGIGSCLTLDGAVECDASVMSGRGGDFGGVGCVPHTQHPIEVAHALWTQRTRGRMSLERVPPMILAGPAAHQFAVQHAPEAAAHPPSCAAASVAAADSSPSAAAASSSSPTLCPLITDVSARKWQSYSRSLSEHESQATSDASAAAASASMPDSTLASDQLSTVGAIVVAPNGDVFAGVSSGGIWMKSPGRIGHAAAFGAGCSAYNPTHHRAGAAVSISGTGEQIMERLLSFSIAQQMRQSVEAPTPPVAAAAASTATGKRKNVSARLQSKRQRLPAGAPVATDDSSSSHESDAEQEEQEEDDSDSLDSILRRALQDEQVASFDTTPPSPHKRDPLAAGVIALQVSALSPSAPVCVELLWGQSTPHFAVGYMARDQSAPTSFISAANAAVAAAAVPAASASRPASVVVAGQRFRFAI